MVLLLLTVTTCQENPQVGRNRWPLTMLFGECDRALRRRRLKRAPLSLAKATTAPRSGAGSKRA